MRVLIISMAWSKVAKTSSTFTATDKYEPMLLLLQTGDFVLTQDNCYINIGDVQQNSFTAVSKISASYTKIAKT